MKSSQRKAIHAKRNYGALTERVNKDQDFKKKVDKFMDKREEKQLKDFEFRKKHEFDAGKCVKGKKHCYKRGYKGSSCIHCGDYIGDN